MDVIQCYETLMKLKAQGKIRSVGVSNFNVSHLRTLIETFRLPPPSVNQLELHPFAARNEIVNYCNKYNIRLSPFRPLCKGGAKGLFRGLIFESMTVLNNKIGTSYKYSDDMNTKHLS
eukprot:330209_1